MITRVSFFVCLLCVALVNAKSNRIVGGAYASLGQFKYQVSVLEDLNPVCGGAIIGEQHVLTAAHCVVGRDGRIKFNDFQIIAGAVNLMTNEGVRIGVAKIYVPRKFVPVELRNDIAVLKLHRRLDLDSDRTISAINLPWVKKSSYAGHTAVIAGYGFTSIESSVDEETGAGSEWNGYSDRQLKYVSVNVISNEECSRKNDHHEVYETQICGQAVQGEQPSGMCRGDSGSPLVQGKVLIGVASSCPVGCMEHKRAAVYTQVSSFIGFISYALKDNESDMLVRELRAAESSSSSKGKGKKKFPFLC